jgi:hypothetical protein
VTLVVAFVAVSGIIATILGKTATLIKVAGRERRVHHSKSMPLLRNEERFFFAHRLIFSQLRRMPIKALKNIRLYKFSWFTRRTKDTFTAWSGANEATACPGWPNTA